MTFNYFASFLLAALTSPVFAFQCYITLVKDSCWTNYDVNVTVINSATTKSIATVDVPKGKSWTRQAFDCDPGMKLMYKANFSPVFWESDKGKSYWAQRYWILPEKSNPSQSAWDIPVCFSSAFSAVPFPPDAAGNCKCDFFDIPSVAPSIPKSE